MIKLKSNNPSGTFSKSLLGLLFVYFVLTSFTIFLLVSVWNTFLANPTVTSLENPMYPVTNVPFPGISICNINKISRERALNLADDIVNQTGESKDKVIEGMKFLGHLYDSDYDISIKTQTENFQKTLDSLKMTIKTVMRSLITPCEQLLHTCQWNGVEVDCSEIFDLRLTFEGYCCTFNYVKNTSEWWMHEDKKKELVLNHGNPTLRNGLSVTVNNNPSDYFYATLATTGINVHVFVPTDYPDKTSGSLIEGLAEMGSENFFEVIPTTVTAVRDVMSFSVDKRSCLFEVEQKTQFGVYSQSDCFVDCRVKSMMTLCECIPFIIPFSDDLNVCTLVDLPCLNKYQTKWVSLVPQNLGELKLKEAEEGLLCSQSCYPACEGTLYEVVTSSVPLHDPEWKNYTSVHIYYRDRYHNLFFQDVMHYWFEILSSYGGLVGLIMGLSLISVIEIVGFCVKWVVSKW